MVICSAAVEIRSWYGTTQKKNYKYSTLYWRYLMLNEYHIHVYININFIFRCGTCWIWSWLKHSNRIAAVFIRWSSTAIYCSGTHIIIQHYITLMLIFHTTLAPRMKTRSISSTWGRGSVKDCWQVTRAQSTVSSFTATNCIRAPTTRLSGYVLSIFGYTNFYF